MVRLAVFYLASLLTFLIIDGLVIFSFGAKVYKNTLGNTLADRFHIPPIALFYLLFIFGLCYFAVEPALQQNRWQIASIRGTIYGLCTYATYTLTCYGVIRNWSFQLAATDLVGGAIIAGFVATTAYFIASLF
jgi:uncharacterized membrane protein